MEKAILAKILVSFSQEISKICFTLGAKPVPQALNVWIALDSKNKTIPNLHLLV